MNEVKEFCRNLYEEKYKAVCEAEVTHHKKLSDNIKSNIEHAAQKEAIKTCIIEGLKHYPKESAANIWRDIYEIHVHRKSGIDNADVIHDVISADQSWKKSSGHAFEEMIKLLSNKALEGSGISIVLQRDLNKLIKKGKIANEPRDISWLKEQIKGNVFDLYALVTKDDKLFCFGCLQSKTSIRDRVTRDREPSLHAMQSFFWSVVITLDGDFLRMPKFTAMVNGGSKEYPANGWHGMYIFTNEPSIGRIYHTDLHMDIFKQHAIVAAKQWLEQRQWFNEDWKPQD